VSARVGRDARRIAAHTHLLGGAVLHHPHAAEGAGAHGGVQGDVLQRELELLALGRQHHRCRHRRRCTHNVARGGAACGPCKAPPPLSPPPPFPLRHPCSGVAHSPTTPAPPAAAPPPPPAPPAGMVPGANRGTPVAATPPAPPLAPPAMVRADGSDTGAADDDAAPTPRVGCVWGGGAGGGCRDSKALRLRRGLVMLARRGQWRGAAGCEHACSGGGCGALRPNQAGSPLDFRHAHPVASDDVTAASDLPADKRTRCPRLQRLAKAGAWWEPIAKPAGKRRNRRRVPVGRRSQRAPQPCHRNANAARQPTATAADR
jgi:hypothetical protein